jgi:mitogen-activated protein kinase kinase kinase 7
MAPEVYYCKLYDQRCDVHSFGLLLWEMFALEKVSDVFDVKTFFEVSLEQGAHPPLDPHWPEEQEEAS